MPPDLLANSCLWYSAPTFGDRILPRGGGRREWALYPNSLFTNSIGDIVATALEYNIFVSPHALKYDKHTM
jgi:hypothetical protein